MRAVLTWLAVRDNFADLMSAASAAACGAAADVPKKQRPIEAPHAAAGRPKPPAPETETPSAAVISGFCNSCPPVDHATAGHDAAAAGHALERILITTGLIIG